MMELRAVAGIRERLERTLKAGELPPAAGQRGAQLLARLNAPVSVVVAGFPGSGKSSIINMLVGQAVLPDNVDLPVVEVVGGSAPRTVLIMRSGEQKAVPGNALDRPLPKDVAIVRLELPIAGLDAMSLTEIRVSGSHVEQKTAVELATHRGDIVLWCTQTFGEDERHLWNGVPDALKDHSFMVLTKADRLLMQGTLADRIAQLQEVVADEFYSLFPVATLQAIAARAAPEGENSALWRASGGRALAMGVWKLVETGRNADADSALLFLNRFGAQVPAAAPETARPVAVPKALVKEAAPTRADPGPAGRALGLIMERAGDLMQSVPDDDRDAQSFVLDHCLATASELADMFALNGADDPDTESGVAEGLDVMLLLQLEQTGEAAEDAVALLLQLKKELIERASALAG